MSRRFKPAPAIETAELAALKRPHPLNLIPVWNVIRFPVRAGEADLTRRTFRRVANGVGKLLRRPIVAVELLENFPVRIQHDRPQIVRHGAVLAPDIQIHLRREFAQACSSTRRQTASGSRLCRDKCPRSLAKSGGVSKSESKEMESNCQLAGALVSASRILRASEKFLLMRGQYSGSGQLVKKNVNATARPRKSEKRIVLPLSLVNSSSGNRSPTSQFRFDSVPAGRAGQCRAGRCS